MVSKTVTIFSFDELESVDDVQSHSVAVVTRNFGARLQIVSVEETV